MRPETESLEGLGGTVSQRPCGVMPAWPFVFYCKKSLGEWPFLARSGHWLKQGCPKSRRINGPGSSLAPIESLVVAAILADLHASSPHQGGPASPALGSLHCKPPHRLRTGLEHIRRIDAARPVIGRHKDRVTT